MGYVTIKNYVDYAYTYEEGQIIFDIILPLLEQGENVTLSFEGIKAVPSSFINAAILQLFNKLPTERITSNLKIINSTIYINEIIKRGLHTVLSKPPIN